MWCCHTILEKDMTTNSEFSMNYLPSNEKLMFLAIIIIPAATAMFVFKFLKKKKCHQIIKDEGPKIVIDPAKAFCQRMKFIVRMKKRMKQFKAKKDAMESLED